MKPQTIKKLFAFLIVLTILTALPKFAVAQELKKCTPQGKCPKGYYCASGYCVLIWPGCQRCPSFILTGGSPADEVTSFSSVNLGVIHFQLMQAEKVSAKIYDATGRLIKTVASKVFEQGEHTLRWDAAGLSAGVYGVQMNAGDYSEMKKISVVK